MTYSLIIIKDGGKVEYKNDILTWPEVTRHLRHKLDQWTRSVTIYKWSSNNKCLGQKYVCMANITDVVLALRDKEVLI